MGGKPVGMQVNWVEMASKCMYCVETWCNAVFGLWQLWLCGWKIQVINGSGYSFPLGLCLDL